MINKLLLFYTYFIVYGYNIFRQTSIQPSIQCKGGEIPSLAWKDIVSQGWVSFFYSNAHLFDLQDDKTDIKYAEMEFMQSIVGENRLIYESNKLEVMKQSPRKAFETIGKVDDFSWLENFDFSQITEEQRNAINNIVDISIKDLKGELDFDWLTKEFQFQLTDSK